MFKAEEHRDCTDRPTRRRELTDRGLRADGEGGPAIPLAGLFALSARHCSQSRAEKYKTTLLRIGTCHSINLSAADGTAGCCESSALPLSPTLSLSLLALSASLCLFLSRYTPAYARSLFLPVSPFVSAFTVRRTVQEGQHPQPSARTRAARDAAWRGEGAVTSSSPLNYTAASVDRLVSYGDSYTQPKRKILSRYCMLQGRTLANREKLTEKIYSYFIK